ncbi:hypothetical protein ABZ401_26050 [Streptomyces sp. NPDC005892]|uniref:hypothetical protein n=1 Tax=Streptomyces sp. NPDC005892 TaxID=3155593 RepID=UPI0033DFF18A
MALLEPEGVTVKDVTARSAAAFALWLHESVVPAGSTMVFNTEWGVEDGFPGTPSRTLPVPASRPSSGRTSSTPATLTDSGALRSTPACRVRRRPPDGTGIRPVRGEGHVEA